MTGGLEVPVRLPGAPPEGVDPAVAEVADQQLPAELTEVGRCLGQAPRRVEGVPGGHAPQEGAVGPEGADEAEAVAGDLILGVGILLGVGHEDRAVDVLDPERRVTRGPGPVSAEARSGRGRGRSGCRWRAPRYRKKRGRWVRLASSKASSSGSAIFHSPTSGLAMSARRAVRRSPVQAASTVSSSYALAA